MQFRYLSQLFGLAAIWGSSFIFMRIAAPTFGADFTGFFRVFFAGLVLIVFSLSQGNLNKFSWKQNVLHFLVVGLFNAALPAILFSYAALSLPSGVSAILNSTTPLFTAVLSYFVFKETLKGQQILGFFLGITGVTLVCGTTIYSTDGLNFLPIIAVLTATFCYGISAVYMRKFTKGIDPIVGAAGSLLLGGLALLPLGIYSALQLNWESVHLLSVLSLVMLAVLCTAIAYVLYFNLTASVGPTKTLTVTFLIPIFGIFWGYLFFQEKIHLGMIVGFLAILSALGITLGIRLPKFNWPRLFYPRFFRALSRHE